MSDELKAAANRFQRGVYGSLEGGHTMQRLDANLLARAYLADLAAREAEERERALPIDREWLLSIGFVRDEFLCRLRIDGNAHRLYFTGDAVQLAKHSIGPVLLRAAAVMTRGEMLDLLAGLKIPTKGGGK